MDKKGNVVLIEINSPGGTELLGCVGINALGNRDIAKKILDEYLIEKFYYDKAIIDWNYREFNDHISLREYHGSKKVIKVPKEINGKFVRILYEGAIPGNQNIKEVIIPESIYVNEKKIPSGIIIKRC